MTLLLVYFLIALVFSFSCSIAEAVLLSVRPSYIMALEKRSPKRARALRTLKDSIDRPLAAILSLNTIAHTVGAVGVGAQAAIVFGSASVSIASAIMTLLILVLSEIIPKTLGALYWYRMAPVIAPAILWFTRIMYPFVWMSDWITRLLSPKDKQGGGFSRDEFHAMAEIGVEEGQINAKELAIVGNLMRLHVVSVRDIMTPRPVIFSLPRAMTVRTFFEQYADRPFSRIPVYSENRDDIVGYVLKSDLLLAQARDEFDTPVSAFQRAFLAIPDILSASAVFDRLAHEKSHIALVVDEYGSVQGLVTLEDVMETLIGLEIVDESDTIDDMRKLAHRRWADRVRKLGIDPESLKG
ncbi:MAG: hemolysin family protein [Sphingomonadales bacterium]